MSLFTRSRKLVHFAINTFSTITLENVEIQLIPRRIFCAQTSRNYGDRFSITPKKKKSRLVCMEIWWRDFEGLILFKRKLELTSFNIPTDTFYLILKHNIWEKMTTNIRGGHIGGGGWGVGSVRKRIGCVPELFV